MTSFFSLEKEQQRHVIGICAAHFNVSSVIVEKDLWVCKILEVLFRMNQKMVFKGGTSLSKAYGLINRFSEDIDVTVDHSHLINIEEVKTFSRSKIKKTSEILNQELEAFIDKKVLVYLNDSLTSIIKLAYDSKRQLIEVFYDSCLSEVDPYVKSTILLEFGIRNVVEPSKKIKISPYLESVNSRKIDFPSANVLTLSPVRTFWEKVTLMHVECHRKRMSQNGLRLSRHWYDLHMLYLSNIGQQSIKSLDIFRDVIELKTIFYNSSYANYQECLKGNIWLVPCEKELEYLEEDFLNMCESNMFLGETPNFETIISSIQNLQDKINETIKKSLS